MSYHLRALEKWGFVQRSSGTDGTDQRERRWQATAQSVRVGEGVAASALLGSTLIEIQFGQVLDRINAAMRQVNLVGEKGSPSMFISTTKLKLSESQRKLFAEDYQTLVDKYRQLGEDSDQQASYLHTVFVPDDPGEVSTEDSPS